MLQHRIQHPTILQVTWNVSRIALILCDIALLATQSLSNEKRKTSEQGKYENKKKNKTKTHSLVTLIQKKI